MTSFRELTCAPDECKVPIGVFYRAEDVPTYEDGLTATQTPGWKRATKPRDVKRLVDALK